MKTYYCVATTICNNGDVSSCITSSIKAEEKPQSKMEVSPNFDYYWDWFDTLKDAQEFVILTLKK